MVRLGPNQPPIYNYPSYQRVLLVSPEETYQAQTEEVDSACPWSQDILFTMRAITLVISCWLWSCAVFGQNQTQIEWGEKFNSGGSQLTFKETSRNRRNGQTVITYSLFASGLPKDVEYTLWTRIADSAPKAVADAYINAAGRVVNVLGDSAHHVAEDPIDLKVIAGRGEPKRFALVSNDGNYRVFGQVVPFPIENASGPCRIAVEMLAANYTSVLIVSGGFQPKEDLQIDTESENESNQIKATATDAGTYQTLLFPQVKGKPSGKTRFNISAKSCRVGVEFPWGQSSYQIQ
jgi:hypothetical protein